MQTAVVFPGQGAQYIGMGKAFFETSLEAKAVLTDCSEGSSLNLEKIILEGPEELLAQTEITQPAIFAVSLAIYKVLSQRLEQSPDYFAGFSLGQYSALTASGVFSVKDGAALLRQRGKFMQEADPTGQMAAIIGLDLKTIEGLLAEIPEYVAVANINCQNQTVISGTKIGVEKAIDLAKASGARRAVVLKVSGAFHSAQMDGAVKRLKMVLENQEIKAQTIPVIGNETAREITDVKESLLRQLTQPVYWQDTVEYLIQKGVTRFIEVGPGRVLTGLIKKIDRSVTVINVEEPNDLDEVNL